MSRKMGIYIFLGICVYIAITDIYVCNQGKRLPWDALDSQLFLWVMDNMIFSFPSLSLFKAPNVSENLFLE